MIFKKVGMENEVSIARSFVFPILGDSFGTGYWETDLIYERHLRPVMFKNERNFIRRFLASARFSFFHPEDVDNYQNFRGEWSARGESNHLHFSFRDENLDSLYDSLYTVNKVVNALLPLLMRGSVFRDTVSERAYPLIDDEFYDYYELDEDDGDGFWDSKSLAYTINTGTQTLEIRINENPFPVLFILLAQPLFVKSFSELPEIRFSRWDEEKRGYYYTYKVSDSEYFEFLIEVIDFADRYYQENSNRFSTGGKVYRSVLKRAKEMLLNRESWGIRKITDTYNLNRELLLDTALNFAMKDSRWKKRFEEFIRFFREFKSSEFYEDLTKLSAMFDIDTDREVNTRLFFREEERKEYGEWLNNIKREVERRFNSEDFKAIVLNPFPS